MQELPEQPVFGLDIGTRSLVGIVGMKDKNGRFHILAMETKEHETRAMIDGQIHDIPKVAESVLFIKESLEAKLNLRLNEVCLAAAGRVLKTMRITAALTFDEGKEVREEDIHALEMTGVEDAYEALRAKSEDEMEFYCVGYSVMRYFIDERQTSNLSEHRGKKIAAEMLATFLPQSVIDDLYKAVDLAGLSVANLTLEPIAAIDVAIPEKFRLLNIALVDVGAGTSDICVTNDGCVTAYGMIPHAGDEITEVIAKHCLVDFHTADQMKKEANESDSVNFFDILGIPQTMQAKEIFSKVRSSMSAITKEITEKIKELNGGKSVSAVFLVGGGGKLKGFSEQIAKGLKLPVERVALRGKEVLGEVDFPEGVEKDPLYVTPVGICLQSYEAKNNFIYVNVNGRRIKLYDTNKLTVLDAVIKAGYTKEDLFPKKGREINFTIDGERRMHRGGTGEAAAITVNDHPAGIGRKIAKNDVIRFTPSTKGAPAVLRAGELKEMKDSFRIYYNGKEIHCPMLCEVNGTLVSELYEIAEGDFVHIKKYYTLAELMELLDLPYHDEIYVNQVLADMDTKIFEEFSITDEKRSFAEEAKVSAPNFFDTERERDHCAIHVFVNEDPVSLTGKAKFSVVDILDFYPFDLSTYQGKLRIEINGKGGADFSSPIFDGDHIGLAWTN